MQSKQVCTPWKEIGKAGYINRALRTLQSTVPAQADRLKEYITLTLKKAVLLNSYIFAIQGQ